MSAEVAIARRSFRQVWIGATVWAVAFGGTVAATALSYVSTFPTVASRQQVGQAVVGQTGLSVLFGSLADIDKVGGYTTYKTFVFLTTIGALWGLLAATKLLRGEEDAGRWQLVLSGSTRANRATIATLAALYAAVGVLFVGTTAIALLAASRPGVGFSVGETVVYGLTLVIAPAVFVGVGAVTSQLCRTRRMATGVAMGVFGVAFVVRMISDAGSSVVWLRWLTPFGWVELVQPFTALDVRPLLLAAAVVAVLVVAAVVGVNRRDVGTGIWSSRDHAEVRPRGLRTPFGFAVRLDLPVLVAWCAGAAATGLSLGLVAKVANESIPESMASTLDRFGARGSFVDQYLGVAFLMVATVVALIPAGQLAAAADEETSGRVVHLLVGPVRRVAWLGGRLGLAVAGIVVAGVLAGVGTWVGARSQGVDVGIASMVGAGLNVVPSAIVALGLGAVVLALAPRAAALSVYVLVVGSLLIDLVASMVSSVAWLSHLSLFHTMALAPGAPADLVTVAVTTFLGLGLCAASVALFQRRDLSIG